LGGRDHKDLDSNPALGKWFMRPIPKMPNTKTGLAEWFYQVIETLSSNPSTTKTKKKYYSLLSRYIIK
jgi:hypothetical protein